ncbi:MAG: TIGR01212 family radical SAM protein [Ruminiclostridium sp.]|nr:TIGR01212 family radical SAM protein [Ruminiclostridium sp.]
MNPFKFSDDNKRYHTLSYHNKHTYGRKVYKAVIDAGFTCPNIDGSKRKGGCIFCDGGSGYFTTACVSVAEQLKLEYERIRKKVPDASVIAYFQAHTNTYAPIDVLRKLYNEAVYFGVDGISVATRGDCINSEVVALLKEIKVPVTVELGLQSIHHKTAELINRGHTYDEFINGYRLLKESGIRVCVHIINGLPYETEDMMLKTAEVLGKLKPDGVKVHLLHVIEGTRLAKMYEQGEYKPLTKDEYVDITVKQLELLPPETVIERITGDGDKSKLIAPLWSMDKISVLGAIDVTQRERDSFQGKKYL